jgi:hypothetical protein
LAEPGNGRNPGAAGFLAVRPGIGMVVSTSPLERWQRH